MDPPPWRVWVAVLVGSLWYFWDYGQTLTQCALCVLLCCVSTPLLLADLGRESGTQTDEVAEGGEEALLQENVTSEGSFCFDIYDGGNSPQVNLQHDISFQLQYLNVKRSLRQVFECAYGQLIRPWYCVPESLECQPLHQALCREFDLVVDQVISRARDFDLCKAVVGSVRILTLHLHNAKQTERVEEMAVLRVFSEALVRNLFPKSLCGLDVNRCALNEIVALKGLELLVMWLSDPDNLNQLVVSRLDTATPKSSVEELCGSDCEGTSSASQEEEEEEEEGEGEESNDMSRENTEEMENCMSHREKMKKRSKKLKAGWTKFVDKVTKRDTRDKRQKKKAKMIEHKLTFRAMTNQGPLTNEENRCSREGSIGSQPANCDAEQGDLENYLASVQEDMMEFKLSYEMWRAGHWAVSIPHVEGEEGELFFTLHLEERDNPENLNWDIRKTYLQVIYFRNRWQDATRLPFITDLEPNSQQEASAKLREEVRASVELFLQELVSDELIGRTQPVFQFLCPLDKLLNEEENGGGVWCLLSGLAFLLTPEQEEDEEEEQNSLNVEANAKVLSSPEPEATTLTGEASRAVSRKKINGMTDDNVPAIDSETNPPASKEHSENSGSDSDTLTSYLKIRRNGLSLARSQESLVSMREADEEVQVVELTGKASRAVARKKINGMTEDIVPAIIDSETNPSVTASKEHSENSGSDSDPLNSYLKIRRNGLSLARSQESLLSMREADEEVQAVELPQQSNHSSALPEDSEAPLAWRHAGGKSNKREKLASKLSSGLHWGKGKEECALSREDNLQGQRGQACRENLEATKAIFDLLKEISGNSILLNIFDTILMPVMPILKKKVNTFLSKMNPTELQMASYIDNMRNKLWPVGAAPRPTTPRTAEEKQETRERAHQLINAKYSSYLILKKTDVENVFRLFQDREENKKLVYMLLSFLLKEFLPHEDALNVSCLSAQSKQ